MFPRMLSSLRGLDPGSVDGRFKSEGRRGSDSACSSGYAMSVLPLIPMVAPHASIVRSGWSFRKFIEPVSKERRRVQDRPVVVDVADADGGAVSGPRSVVVLQEFGLDGRDIGVLGAVIHADGSAWRPVEEAVFS